MSKKHGGDLAKQKAWQMSIGDYPCVRHCTKRRIQDNRQLASGICLRRFFIRRFIFKTRCFGLLSAQSMNATHLPPSERESHLSEQSSEPEGSAHNYQFDLFLCFQYLTGSIYLGQYLQKTALNEEKKKTKMGKRLEGSGQGSKSKGKFCKRRHRNWLGALGQGWYRLSLKAMATHEE